MIKKLRGLSERWESDWLTTDEIGSIRKVYLPLLLDVAEAAERTVGMTEDAGQWCNQCWTNVWGKEELKQALTRLKEE